jgi:predicted phage-related endonuclease
MNILDVSQGTDAWLEIRKSHDTASEAPAALGQSKYMTRAALLHQKATGMAEEVDGFKQSLFDRGHEAESNARPIAERIIGASLYPVTASLHIDGLDLLASLDGATMSEEVIFEHKLYNENLAADVRTGALHPHYTIQLDQQLLVSGAKKCLFMTSDGTEQNMAYCWYESDQSKFDALISGWRQFKADLAAYVPSAEAVEAIGRTPDNLPALRIEVTGMVTASNLHEYKDHALSVFKGINRELTTDQHFADAEKTVKWCGDVEDRIAAAKQHALSQTATIDDLFRTLDSISAEARATRLELDKLVKARKEALREEIRQGAVNALRDHYTAVNAGFSMGITLPVPASFGSDIATAMKGKKTLASLRDAADTTLANAKIEADKIADRVRKNIDIMKSADDHYFLFPDLTQLIIGKETEVLDLMVKSRISEHKAAEAKKAEELRARIAEEERAKAEANVKAEQEISAPPHIAKIHTPAAWPFPSTESAKATETPATPPTLTLGKIGTRLGFNLTADFLRSIGFEPAGKERAAVLYHESSFPLICDAMIDRIQKAQKGLQQAA